MLRFNIFANNVNKYFQHMEQKRIPLNDIYSGVYTKVTS